MLKKIINKIFSEKNYDDLDAKIWIQKVLLNKNFSKKYF